MGKRTEGLSETRQKITTTQRRKYNEDESNVSCRFGGGGDRSVGDKHASVCKLEFKGERPAENSDSWVHMKVKTALLFHRNVSGLKTEVTVKDGIVTLRGEASSQAQKDLTTEYVKDVEGVKDVKNEMTLVKTSGKSDKTVGEKIDDASVTAQVKMTLLSHRSTSALNTKVKTKDGVVTLSGKAKNAAEKDLATKFVKDVNGVKSVNNEMTVE